MSPRRTLVTFSIVMAFFGFDAAAMGETFTTDQGSSTWPDGNAGLSGTKVGTNGASITVTTSTTVNAGHTAIVSYQIGIVQGGQFMKLADYSRNLTAGANQQVQQTFSGMSQGVQYTVKAQVKFDNLTPNQFSDRPITVGP